jgi:hypothetical protein
MMNTKRKYFFQSTGAGGRGRTAYIMLSVVLLASLLLSGCGAMVGRGGPAGGPQQAAVISTATPAAPTKTAQPTSTRKPRPTITPTEDIAKTRASQAEQAARDYFAALEAGDLEEAAGQLSTFSLMVFGMTRGDAASALQKMRLDGARWSGLQVTETKPFDEQTMLVHVAYTLTVKEEAQARDELWPVRLESDAWRYNWNNLIDYRMLQVNAQTTSGVTVKPVQINRFSDRIQLVMLVQNRTSGAVVLGQKNEVLGTFHFGDQAVEADKMQIVLNPLRSVPDVKLEATGLWERYPEMVEIRKWKTYNVKPWYVFQLQ